MTRFPSCDFPKTRPLAGTRMSRCGCTRFAASATLFAPPGASREDNLLREIECGRCNSLLPSEDLSSVISNGPCHKVYSCARRESADMRPPPVLTR